MQKIGVHFENGTDDIKSNHVKKIKTIFILNTQMTKTNSFENDSNVAVELLSARCIEPNEKCLHLAKHITVCGPVVTHLYHNIEELILTLSEYSFYYYIEPFSKEV